MKLMILDGNSIINRAFYGIRPLSTRDGLCTNAIFGFLSILEKLRAEEKPDALCAAFDLKAPTFRHKKFSEYKANRTGMPDDLAVQMPYMKKVLAAMNIPIYELEGWEADDVIGTVSRICHESGWNCVIATGDRDSLQLISDSTYVRLSVSKAGQTTWVPYTQSVFTEEYGFAPDKLVDLKALMGDSSDNIPGVAGIGPKTAKDLLWKFGSLDGIYAACGDPAIRASVCTKLAEHKEMAYLSYDLATIRCDAPLTFRPEDALVQAPNVQELHDLFLRLEFSKLLDRYGLRATQDDGRSLTQLPSATEPCAVVFDAARENIGIANAGGAIAVPVSGNLSYLRELFSMDTPKTCADLKGLFHTLSKLSLPANGLGFDISVAGYLLDPSAGDYSVGRLSMAYLSRELPDGDLAAAARAVWKLREETEKKLREENLFKLFEEVDLPLCRVLYEMESCGISVDREALQHFGEILTGRIATCQASIFNYAGEEFNINSTKKLGEILFEKLELPPVKKTKTGYSTGAEVLEKLKSRHPIVEKILEYRMLTKLNSTYAEGLMKVIRDDGRIHTTFQNTVTATGRLSSTDPNLQNIPVRTDMGSEIRKMFVPRAGWKLVDADYSQIELRVLSHIADDQVMQEAFRSGADFHTATASQVFGVPVEDVTTVMRRNAKAVNFGIVYGISEFSLADDIGVSRAEAKAYIETYLARFSGVAAYMKDVVVQAARDGYVTTLFGRKRYIPELQSKNHMLRSAAERIALNTPIQGTAADIMKIATIRVAEAFCREKMQARLVLQVHDELIAECPAEEAEAVKGILETEMEGAAALRVPLTAEAKVGDSWYDAK